MQQIADWLQQLGMQEYIQQFAENDIDFAILSDLTDQDLEKIGVTSLGHRRKLLHAIAHLKGGEKSAPAIAVAVAASSAPPLAESAERRQVTVLFSDLVGSTALSVRMDPEDLREVIAAYQKCVAEVVRRFGGFVAKYLGDGVLVYFGYPEAHEDDAERAVRAGLELIAAVGALKTAASLRTRIGIATGLVVVGDLIGSGEALERGIVGETPNLAARLQGIAEPNTVIISEGTRKLLGALFELEDLEPKDLKGIAGPVRAWAVLRAGTVESRFEALHATGLIALVGREEETELLLRRWSRAKSGEGQVVLLSGEAGIGKSRLTAALVERVASEPHTRLRYFCSPQHTDSPFHPIIGQMVRAAGLVHDDSAKAKLDKLDALLAQTTTSVEHAALFAEMLSLPSDGRYPSLDALIAEQRRQRTLEAKFPNGKAGTAKSRPDDLRGCALGRPYEPGSFQSVRGSDRDNPHAADRDFPAGVRVALDRTTSRDRPYVKSTGTARGRRHHRPGRWQQAASGQHPSGHHRAQRWHSAVHRGDDKGGDGGRESGRRGANDCCHSIPGPGGPRKPARIVNGTARQAWRG
jgi:class 3 adenylate cyclase